MNGNRNEFLKDSFTTLVGLTPSRSLLQMDGHVSFPIDEGKR